MVGLISFILTVLAILSGLVALALMLTDDKIISKNDRIVSYLLLVTVVFYAAAWAIVRTTEAGLW